MDGAHVPSVHAYQPMPVIRLMRKNVGRKPRAGQNREASRFATRQSVMTVP